MSQHLDVPIELEFRIPRCSWTLAKAIPLSWWNSYSDAELNFEVYHPQKFKGTILRKAWSYLPSDLLAILPLRGEQHSTHVQRYEQEILQSVWNLNIKPLPSAVRAFELDVFLCSTTEALTPRDIRHFDPWTSRSRMLALGRDHMAIREYLETCGLWKNALFPETNRVSGYLLDEFSTDQQTIRNGVLDASAWFKGAFSDLRLKTRDEFPHLYRSLVTAYEAISASVTIDHLRGSQFRVCARTDCGEPFKLESRHKRLYCSHDCGHLVSIRNGRAAGKS